jgi:cytochrome P450
MASADPTAIASSRLDDALTRFFALDPATVAKPFPVFESLRARGPAYRHGGRVLVSHYAEARQVLNDPNTLQGFAAKSSRGRQATEKLGPEQRRQFDEVFAFWERRLSGANGDQHRRLRRLAQGAFTIRVVNEIEERVDAAVDEILDPLRGRDSIDFVDDFAYRLPLRIISDMLDIPEAYREQVRACANGITDFLGADWSDIAAIRAAHEALSVLRDYVSQRFSVWSRDGTTHLVRGLLDAVEDGRGFELDELVAMTVQLLVAGHETTTNLLGNTMVALLIDAPDQWDLLCKEPDLLGQAVEELLRYASPIQCIDKMAQTHTVIGDVEVEPFDTIAVLAAAANRDQLAFSKPDVVDVTQRRGPHVSLGHGAHHCLGAALARLEMRSVLRSLTHQFPKAMITGAPIHKMSSQIRGLVSLPMNLNGDDRGIV